MNNKSKKRTLFTSGILSFIVSVGFLFRSMFVVLDYKTKDHIGSALASGQAAAINLFVIALGFVILATYCVHKASKVELDDVESEDEAQADKKTVNE